MSRTTLTLVCDTCNRRFHRTPAQQAQATKLGCVHTYCSRACGAVAKRTWKTKEQRIAEKAAYDLKRRKRYAAWLRTEKKRKYEEAKATDLAALRTKQKAYRDATKQQHLNYLRKPEYRAKKKTYDARLRASVYGPYAECYRLYVELKKEIVARVPSWYERHTETVLERSKRYRMRQKEK